MVNVYCYSYTAIAHEAMLANKIILQRGGHSISSAWPGMWTHRSYYLCPLILLMNFTAGMPLSQTEFHFQDLVSPIQSHPQLATYVGLKPSLSVSKLRDHSHSAVPTYILYSLLLQDSNPGWLRSQWHFISNCYVLLWSKMWHNHGNSIPNPACSIYSACTRNRLQNCFAASKILHLQ